MDMMGRFGDAPTKEECEWMVLGAIHARNELFKKDFRKARQPSKLALKALKNKKVERRFWTRLEARHPALKFGQGKAFAPQRMCWSTLGVLKKHGKELQAFFKDCGVMNSRGQWIQSELRRVGNTDECPSHAGSGANADRATRAFTTGGPRRYVASEHSELITFCPLLLRDGTLAYNQIIVKSSGDLEDREFRFDADVDALSTVQDQITLCQGDKSAFQDTDTFLVFLEGVVERLEQLDIKISEAKPFCLLSDGHKTRLTIRSLRYMRSKHIRLYLFPPHATTLYQPLDQLFASFHQAYVEALRVWRRSRSASAIPTKSQAVNLILCIIAKGWSSIEKRMGAWSKCCMGPDGIDITVVDKKKLIPEEETLASQEERDFLRGCPQTLERPEQRHDEEDHDYMSRVATFFEAAYHREVQRPVTLRELRVLELPRDQPTAEGKTKRTSVYGCIKGKRLLESLQEAEQEADAAAETKRLKLDLEAPVRELLVELGYVGADDTMKRAMLSLFAKKNKETFSFVRVGTQLLHYAKRDEIVQKVRRWMVEGEFDPSEEGAGEGSPRSVAELIVQLVPNALPEHDEAGEPGPAPHPTA